MVTRNGPKLEVVVPSEGMDHAALAAMCVEIANRAGIPERSLSVYGRPLSAQELENQLSGKRTFVLEGDGFQAHLACITDFRIGYLTVDGIGWNWLDDCATHVSNMTSLVSCRWVDAKYDYWQNVDDPMLYQVAGRSMDGLPTRSKELPPPLARMIVDISSNPGRRIVRDGYVEAISHRMLLGPEFFNRVPRVRREAVVSAGWLRITERAGGILDVIAEDQPFVDASSTEVQNRLRRLLFPTTAGT
jgi:hypothetical protein